MLIFVFVTHVSFTVQSARRAANPLKAPSSSSRVFGMRNVRSEASSVKRHFTYARQLPLQEGKVRATLVPFSSQGVLRFTPPAVVREIFRRLLCRPNVYSRRKWLGVRDFGTDRFFKHPSVLVPPRIAHFCEWPSSSLSLFFSLAFLFPTLY